MRAFAYEYGESIAGMILVDASHEDQEERYRTANAAEEVPWFFKFVPFAASRHLSESCALLDLLRGWTLIL